MLNREGLEEAADVACLPAANEEREEEAPTPREFRDALETVASVVRLRAAMFAPLSGHAVASQKRDAKSKLFYIFFFRRASNSSRGVMPAQQQ